MNNIFTKKINFFILFFTTIEIMYLLKNNKKTWFEAKIFVTLK